MQDKYIVLSSNPFGKDWFYDKWLEAYVPLDWNKAITDSMFKNCTFTNNSFAKSGVNAVQNTNPLRQGLSPAVIELGEKVGGYDFPCDQFQLDLVLGMWGRMNPAQPKLCDCGATIASSLNSMPCHANWCSIYEEVAVKF